MGMRWSRSGEERGGERWAYPHRGRGLQRSGGLNPVPGFVEELSSCPGGPLGARRTLPARNGYFPGEYVGGPRRLTVVGQRFAGALTERPGRHSPARRQQLGAFPQRYTLACCSGVKLKNVYFIYASW
jgi:hypothetical protein